MVAVVAGLVAGIGGADPTPSPDIDIELPELLRQYGIDADRGEFWHVSGFELLGYIAVAAVAILVLRSIYRGMQRPRLALNYHDDRPPTTSAAAIARYAVTPFLLIPLWYASILGILVLAANRGQGLRPGQELLIAAGVVVGGSRLLAHVNLEGAHELAKSVPLTMVSIIIISGTVISLDAFLVTSYLLALNLVAIAYFVVWLAALDAVFTFGWLLWRRAEWHHQHRRAPDEGEAARRPSWLEDLWRALVSGWGGRQSGPAQRPGD